MSEDIDNPTDKKTPADESAAEQEPKKPDIKTRVLETLPAAKTRTKKSVKQLYAVLLVMATFGSAAGFVQLFINKDAPNASIVCGALSESMQKTLLEKVAAGTIKVKDIDKIACAMAGQAFAEAQPEQETVQDSPRQRFTKSVKELAQSKDDAKRRALVLISHSSTRADGLDMLASAAITQDDWRQAAELAYPWDTARAITAYEHLTSLASSDTWAHIYLSRLYVRSGNIKAAHKTIIAALTTVDNENDKKTLFTELGMHAQTRGDLPKARRFFTDALKISKKLVIQDSSNPTYQHGLSVAHERLGDITELQNNLKAANAHYMDAYKIRKTLASKHKSNPVYLRALSVSLQKLGDIARFQNNYDAAKAYYTQSQEISVNLSTLDKTNAVNQRTISVNYVKLGEIARDTDDQETALTYYTNALNIRETLALEDPSNADYQNDLALVYDKLGELSMDMDKMELSLSYYSKGVIIREKLAKNDMSSARYLNDLIVSYEGLGNLAMVTNDPKTAQNFYEKMLVIMKALTAKDPSNMDYQYGLSSSYNRLGNVAAAQNDKLAARIHYINSLKIAKVLAGADKSNAFYQRVLMVPHVKLASLDGADAQEHWQQAYLILKALDDIDRLRPSDRDIFDELAGKANIK